MTNKAVALFMAIIAISLLAGVVASAAGSATTVYRLFNTSSGQHLVTLDANENTTLKRNPIWIQETASFDGYAAFNGNCASGLIPVYRIVNSRSGEHLLTADTNELFTWTGSTHGYWYSEGVGFCAYSVAANGLVPVYRLYNHVSGEHLLTADQNEVYTLDGRYNWVVEPNGNGGIVFYAPPAK